MSKKPLSALEKLRPARTPTAITHSAHLFARMRVRRRNSFSGLGTTLGRKPQGKKQPWSSISAYWRWRANFFEELEEYSFVMVDKASLDDLDMRLGRRLRDHGLASPGGSEPVTRRSPLKDLGKRAWTRLRPATPRGICSTTFQLLRFSKQARGKSGSPRPLFRVML